MASETETVIECRDCGGTRFVPESWAFEAARREGYIAGLEKALAEFPYPGTVARQSEVCCKFTEERIVKLLVEAGGKDPWGDDDDAGSE